MAEIIYSNTGTRDAVASMVDDFAYDAVTGSFSSELSLTLVREVKFTWSTFRATLDAQSVEIAGDHIHLNTADVAVPTTYYVYCEPVAGVPTVVSSTLNPIINPLVDEYFILGVIRFTSIAGTLVTYFTKYPSQDGTYEFLHNLKENVMFYNPIWLSGINVTMSAGGKISTDAGYVRFVGNEPRTQGADTEGTIALDDETTVAGIDSITTYADGSAITDTKFHKLLLGVLRDKSNFNTTKYIIMRQNKPGTEYATAAAAKTDAENMASVGFPAAYLASVTPIAYLITKKADYTAAGFEVVDIRSTGIVKGAGGAAATSHHALADLVGFDDHSQYLRTDGTRDLSGAWSVTKAITTTAAAKALTFESTQATGTAPLTVASTTVVTNLNADTVDGHQAAEFFHVDGTSTMTGNVVMGGKDITGGGAIGSATVTTSGLTKALTFESTQATGTAPMVVASTTKVTNLNADQLDGIEGAALLKADGTTPLTGAWDVGSYQVRAETFQSDVATGTAPFTVASTTVVTNLNADYLDGLSSADYAPAAKGVTNGDTHDHAGGDGAQIAHSGLSGLTTGNDHTQYLLKDGTVALTGNWAAAKNISTVGSLTGATLVSTVATGTAPLTVASTTQVANLNAASLNGVADTGFIKADGSVVLTGNLQVQAATTIDGVDISVHAATANAHHNAVTFGDNITAGLATLTTQAIELNTQTANTVLAGPTTGAATYPAFRALVVADIPRQPSAALTLANTGNDNVAVSERKSVVYITGPTSNFSVTGFIMGGANVDGMVLRLHNGTAKVMTLTNDATSTASNRIYSGGKTIAAGNGCTLVYNASVSRWLLAS